MVGSLTFVAATRFEDDSRDCAKNISDRLSPGCRDPRVQKLPWERTVIDDVSTNLTMPATAAASATATATTAETAPATATATATAIATSGSNSDSNTNTTTIAPSLTTTSMTSMTRDREPDAATDERRIYSDWFLASCAELASCNDLTRDRGIGTATTWFFQVRRRCSNICNWLPKVCSCTENGVAIPWLSGRPMRRVGSYERFGSRGSDVFEFGRTASAATVARVEERANGEHGGRSRDDHFGNDQVLELRFHNDDDDDDDDDDDTWNSLLVEENLRADDACRLLKVKRNVSGNAWSIVEEWPELGIERTLEDHEDIVAVHRDARTFASRFRSKFLFRTDYLKYEFFVDPKQFFPSDMIAFPPADNSNDNENGDSANSGATLIDEESALRNYLLQENAPCPQVLSPAWVRNGYFDAWRKMYLLLRNEKLYVLKKMNELSTRRFQRTERLTTFAHLSDFVVYKIANAKGPFRAPFEWGLCLKPSNTGETKSTVAGESCVKVVAFQTERSRVCWLTAMRLAKYGKQLRDNYRAYKNKQCEQTSGDSAKERYSSYNVSNESVRSLVAMDFTGSVGRIVDDPKEAKGIAESEGIDWRRTWRPFLRPPPGCAVVRLHGLDDGIHVLQPWFHRGLKRDIAAAIVRDHGSVDGVFLVRESKSNLGAYVLTYKYSDKVFHAQIQPVFDERCNCWLYTLDKGVTKFYDLLQLIAFYQLNAGSLPTRLTHYVQNVVPGSLPIAEEDGASPSSPTPPSPRSPPSPPSSPASPSSPSPSPTETAPRFVATASDRPEKFASHGSIRG
nr:growth factor receptor-bound protein 14-like isoform X5 [Megalopta genalis]XP_033338566.1 growth factor receptor-bound protein 14-like isoform X5 [Megalopta genalis]